MSTTPALHLEGVSKKYRVFASPRARLREALLRRPEHEEFCALQNVSLDLPTGRTLGVLGLNGSGKSTLLKIIAGILEPTEGKVEVNGRVAALLELGAGFNPELSGRENVITNALIQGLTHRQSLDRLAEVERFADIGRHFGQPVKTYSSGMYMRVAFAMSICVDPDILIIDEALSVGDVKFQEKCFRRLKEFQAKGRTILFVTHDRASVTQLCDDAILLHGGQLAMRGEPVDVVAAYTELMTTGLFPRAATSFPAAADGPFRANGAHPLEHFLADMDGEDKLARHPLYNPHEDRFGTGGASIVDVLLRGSGQVNPTGLLANTEVEIFVKFRTEVAMAPVLGITLCNTQGVVVYATNTQWQRIAVGRRGAHEVGVLCFRGRLPLPPGPIFLDVAVASDAGPGQTTICDRRGRALVLEIFRDRMFQGLADLGFTIEERSHL